MHFLNIKTEKCMFVVRFWLFNRITYRKPGKEGSNGMRFEGE